MSKQNYVFLLDCYDEEAYTAKLEEIKTMVTPEIRIIIADTDFYLTKIGIMDKIFGRDNKITIMDINPIDTDNQIKYWMTKWGFEEYETLT